MKNVVLVGFMGTGKSVIGRAVARILGYEFIDTDQMVEEATGLTINQIFKKYGEVRFRSEEVLAAKKLADRSNLVIATGGGMVLNPENVDLLKNNGTLVLLTACPEVILERVSRKNTRPLLEKGKNLENIKALFLSRSEIYEKCTEFCIDTSNKPIDELAEEIVKMVKDAWSDENS